MTVTQQEIKSDSDIPSMGFLEEMVVNHPEKLDEIDPALVQVGADLLEAGAKAAGERIVEELSK